MHPVIRLDQPLLLLQRIFFHPSGFLWKAKNNRVKKSSFESRVREKIDAASFSRLLVKDSIEHLPSLILTTLFFDFLTFPHATRYFEGENLIFWPSSEKVKTSFIIGLGERWVCLMWGHTLHVNNCNLWQKLRHIQQVEHCLKCCLQWFWKGSWKAYCLSWGEGTKMQTLKTWQEFGRKCKVFSPKIWNIVAYFKCTCVGLRQHCLDFRARNRRWFMIIERKCIDSDVRDISWETAQKLLKGCDSVPNDDLWEMIICSVY